MILMSFRGSGHMFHDGKIGPAAPISTFARFQAGFLSSEDFHGFHIFSWISIDFHGFVFHGFSMIFSAVLDLHRFS